MKKIIAILILVFLSAGFIYADVIKLKNGKTYKCFIMYYDDGKYTVLMNGKKYPVLEDSIEAIKWDSNDNEIASAYRGEPLPQKKKRGYDTGTYAKGVVDFVLQSGEENILITGGMQIFPSIEFGWILGPVNFGIQASMGFSSGRGNYSFYTDYDGYVNGTYDISRTVLLFLLTNTTTFDVFGDLPVKPFLGAALGGGFTADSLSDYPVLADYYSQAGYSDKTETYPSFSVEGKVGLMYSVSEKVKASAFVGYRALSGSTYAEPVREDESYYESSDIFDFMSNTSNFGGIMFGLDCSFIF